MSEEIIEIQALIKGQVQGVGFRATARQLAVLLGIKGTVRNTLSGEVELIAQGKRSCVEEFLKKLRELNSFIKVTSLSSKEIIPLNHYNDFQIIF